VPNPKHAQRPTVLSTAKKCGWSHEHEVFDHGYIVRDVFRSELGEIRAVWLKTPWSDSLWTGAIFSDKKKHEDRNVWKVSAQGGLLDLLKKAPVPTAG
jgi:hypothetical protein